MGSNFICLGEIANLSSGGTPSKRRGDYWGGSIPWVSAKSMDADRLNSNLLFITEEGLEAGSRLAPSGSILLLTRGSGLFNRIPVIWIDAPLAFNQDIKCITAKDPLETRYVYHWLCSQREHLSKILDVTGIGAGKINTDQLLSLDMFWPDYSTRRKIVAIADSLVKKLMINQEENDYLAEIADALFADAFGNLEDNAVLSDIANITMGQSPAGTSYNEEGVGTVFYQGRGEFGWRYPTRRLFTTEPKRMAKSGDVLMSVRAPVGDLNLAYEDCCIGRGLVAISCDYPSYCLYLMRSLGKKLDAYNGEGTVFGSISGKALKGIGIGLPGNDDIAAFEAMVAPIDAQIRCNETESRILSQLRDALLPKLMSGEIDVSKVDLTRLNNHFA